MRYLAAKLMEQMDLVSFQVKIHKYKHADQEHRIHNDILDRSFSLNVLNQVWTGDLTYVCIKGGLGFRVQTPPIVLWQPKGGYGYITEALSAITDYIWGYYQTVRPHTFNNYLKPVEKEKRYFNKNLLSDVLN